MHAADMFVDMETLRRSGFTERRPDQTVQVRWGMGSKGCMAAELRPDAHLPPKHRWRFVAHACTGSGLVEGDLRISPRCAA